MKYDSIYSMNLFVCICCAKYFVRISRRPVVTRRNSCRDASPVPMQVQSCLRRIEELENRFAKSLDAFMSYIQGPRCRKGQPGTRRNWKNTAVNLMMKDV